MDAFPGYTLFDRTKKVLCVIQILDDTSSTEKVDRSVMLHESDTVDTGLFKDEIDSVVPAAADDTL